MSLAAGLGLCIIGSAAAETGGAASYQAAPCDGRGLDPVIAQRLQCGAVTVPRDSHAPAAGTFRLAVVIIKTRSTTKQADPVVYLAGGPGAPLTVRAALIARHEADVVAPDRDLVLVDQRGAGRSEPLLCPDLARQQWAVFAAGADEDTLVRAWRDSFGLCRLQMADDGVKPDWFGTQVTAEDVEAVRRALGIERWNVYALSYGTAVGMTMMALHPESLRAVVLDSVLPRDPLPMTLAQTFDRALNLVFAACRADAPCASAHPDLAAAFGEASRALDADPLPVPMKAGLGVATVRLRAELFRLIVDRLLYSRAGMAEVPSFIDAARARDPMALEETIARVAHNYLTMSTGVLAAVTCRDRPNWQESGAADEPPVSAFVPGMCAHWSAPGPPPLIASDTAVPSLLLAGTNDPITPPDFARLAATRMGSKARVVAFAHVGHGVEPSSPCGETLVTTFLRDPSGPLDVACAAQAAPVTFR